LLASFLCSALLWFTSPHPSHTLTQHLRESITDITPEQLERTFATNLFSHFYLAAVSVTLRALHM
jgi:NAD(P)-dependent dehydrogenase (short-subunit alcohol dehydrogenase family)